MGSPTYTFSAGDNGGVVNAMQDSQSAIKTELGNMDHEVSGHLNNWTADSKAQYHDAKIRWDAAADTMPQSLSFASESLMQITQRLKQADASVQGMW